MVNLRGSRSNTCRGIYVSLSKLEDSFGLMPVEKNGLVCTLCREDDDA